MNRYGNLSLQDCTPRVQPNTSLFFTLVVWELERMDGTFLQQGLIEYLCCIGLNISLWVFQAG